MKTKLNNLWYNVSESLGSYAPTRGMAFILGLCLLCYGGWLVIPGASFVNPIYATMAKLASEPTWGAVFIFAGIALISGVWKKSSEWISRGSWLGFFLWTTVAILGVIADGHSPVLVVRFTIAAMHAWVYIQNKLHPELVDGRVKITDLRAFIDREQNIHQFLQKRPVRNDRDQ